MQRKIRFIGCPSISYRKKESILEIPQIFEHLHILFNIKKLHCEIILVSILPKIDYKNHDFGSTDDNVRRVKRPTLTIVFCWELFG